jgi:glycosyltransferase involved in cell wall biosynthesis
MHKKLLLISYYWPPAGGPGVQRWLKFTKYLPEFCWEPTLFIPENPSYPIIDESLESEVSLDLNIIKTKIWEPYQLAEIFGKDNKKFKAGQFDVKENQSWKSKLSIFVRGNFFIPDARVFWVKPSITYLKKYLRDNHFDAIVTTGPPHSMHLIGLGLKREFPDLKWIADFRDPWTEISYYKHLKLTKFADKKHKKFEQQVFQNADITLATSFADAEHFRKKGANSFCITNGFDGEIKSENSKTEKFTLSYIGILEQLRNPENLWGVLENLIIENQDFKKDFTLKFVGRIDDKILEKFQDYTFNNSIKNLGYLSHKDSNKEMKQSDLLLITNFPQEKSKGIIPGKLFEYLQTGNTILSFGPKEADVEKILSETHSGKHFSYKDSENLEAFILEQYDLWNTGKFSSSERNIEQYSRRNLTKKLVEVLEL